MLEDMKPADPEQLLALEAEFRDLALKESDIVAQLNGVIAEKQRVRRLIAATKNPYARIYSLPDELLVFIVETAQNLQWTDPASALIEVTASHISQRFRYAILGASSLWSSIELRWGMGSDEDRFAAYLLRSRNSTLSVRLRYDTYDGEYECLYEDVRNELGVLAKHISRIRCLFLHCGEIGLTLQDAVEPLHDLHAPCLEHLEISFDAMMDFPNDPFVSLFNGGAPRLRTLKLKNTVVGSTSDTNSWLPFVTTIKLVGMDHTGDGIWSRVLGGCPHLVDVTLDASTFHDLGLIDISMPALRSFTALRLNPNHTVLAGLLVCVLACIRAPALESLQLSGVHGEQISYFFNNISHSHFPALKSLTFAASSGQRCTKCALPEHIPPKSFDSFSALTSLTIINMCHMDKLVGDLLQTSKNADGSTVHNLPALQTLTLRYKDVDNFGIDSWPKLPCSPYLGVWLSEEPGTDPMGVLRQGLAARRETHPIQLLRLPRSRFFTEQCWSPDVAPLEIFDVQPLLQSLGYGSEDNKMGVMEETESLWSNVHS
ncbi:hypothetical protein C8F04DRAFT_1237361 [Mycena alexandri]|uniref:F-box domain-containing protein n=1 Tax=Mycena alexandri TaxID=1745969 RepID=A0AAD6SLY9_9AGAR|nr:hypothetical protein C8F04DRAFT_1237361 [Mycena alexandri]